MKSFKLFVSLVVFFFLAAGLVLAGCAPQAAKEAIKASMVTDVGGLGDKGFNDGVWAGLQRAKSELGVEVGVVTSKEAKDYVSNLSRLAEEGNDVIFGVGFLFAPVIGDVAKKYPDVKFGGVDIELFDENFQSVDVDNLREILFKEQESSYLAGIVAGMMTKETTDPKLNPDNIIGVVAGMKIPPVDRWIAGFIAGAKSVNPDVKVLVKYTETFTDPAAGKEAALAQFNQGADIVFQVAGLTGLGVIEAAKETNHFAIGVDTDQNYLAPEHVLTSALKNLEEATFSTVKDAVEGKFAGGNFYYGLSNNGVGLAPFHDLDDIVPQAVKDAVEKAKQDIIDGKVTPPTAVEGLIEE